jgi:hypothetical protein
MSAMNNLFTAEDIRAIAKRCLDWHRYREFNLAMGTGFAAVTAVMCLLFHDFTVGKMAGAHAPEMVHAELNNGLWAIGLIALVGIGKLLQEVKAQRAISNAMAERIAQGRFGEAVIDVKTALRMHDVQTKIEGQIIQQEMAKVLTGRNA